MLIISSARAPARPIASQASRTAPAAPAMRGARRPTSRRSGQRRPASRIWRPIRWTRRSSCAEAAAGGSRGGSTCDRGGGRRRCRRPGAGGRSSSTSTSSSSSSSSSSSRCRRFQGLHWRSWRSTAWACCVRSGRSCLVGRQAAAAQMAETTAGRQHLRRPAPPCQAGQSSRCHLSGKSCQRAQAHQQGLLSGRRLLLASPASRIMVAARARSRPPTAAPERRQKPCPARWRCSPAAAAPRRRPAGAPWPPRGPAAARRSPRRRRSRGDPRSRTGRGGAAGAVNHWRLCRREGWKP
jgi:hypothetical protein